MLTFFQQKYNLFLISGQFDPRGEDPRERDCLA